MKKQFQIIHIYSFLALDWLQFWLRFRGLHIGNGLAACYQSVEWYYSA